MADTRKYLDLTGLQTFYENLKDSSKNFSLVSKAEHAAIASAQANVIEKVLFKGNGDASASALTITDKGVTIDVSAYAKQADVTALQTTVGNASSGLVKDVSDIKASLAEGGATALAIAAAKKAGDDALALIGTVPANVNGTPTSTVVAYVDAKVAETASTSGELNTRLTAVESKVGDSTKGLVKDVADLKTTVGNAGSGLVKKVTDIETSLTETGTVGAKIKANADAIAGIKNGKTLASFGDVEAELTGYQKAIAENTYAAYAYQAKVDTLIGEDANKSARAIAKEEADTAVAGVVASAPEAFDTLKEIANWIGSGAVENTTAASMLTDINNLKTTVGDADSGLVKDVADLKAVGAQKVEASATNGNIKIGGVETQVYRHATKTEHAAAFVKVGNDAEGHVVVGDAIVQADIDAILAVASASDITGMMAIVDAKA